MKYKDFGKTGMSVSRFGFGCMRFPESQKEITRMVRYAIDKGVNYFDTAHSYKGSEESLGKALVGGYREKIHIAGKNPINKANSRKDLDKFLGEELRRLQTDYLDIHLLHFLTSDRWEKSCRINAFRFLEDAKKTGKIRFAGFSFHGTLELFKEIVDSHDWDVAQIQLNYMDINHQAGLEGLHYASGKGIPVVIMEPLKGGGLVDKLPAKVIQAFENYPIKRSPAEWSFRWLIDKPEIPTVLSGVSTMEQLKENIRIFSETDSGCKTGEDQALIEKVIAEFDNTRKVDCTHCGYCMPCPSGVDIPDVFQFYNDTALVKYGTHARLVYQVLTREDKSRADRCTECGTCEPLCPQSIPIIEKLKEAHRELSS